MTDDKSEVELALDEAEANVKKGRISSCLRLVIVVLRRLTRTNKPSRGLNKNDSYLEKNQPPMKLRSGKHNRDH